MMKLRTVIVTPAVNMRARFISPAHVFVLDFYQHIAVRLRRNYAGYWNQHRWSVAALCLAAVADYMTTVQFMINDGIDLELNPAFRMTATYLGPVLGPLLGKITQLLAAFLITVYLRNMSRYIFFSATIIYTWAALYNIFGRYLN